MWVQYPGEIASDLSQYHHRRIADWHQGTMPSYELLELCEYMDDRGRLKAAQRENGILTELPQSEHEQAVFQTANSTAVLTAGMVPDADSEDWGGRLFIPPALIRAEIARHNEAYEAMESVFAMATVSEAEFYGWATDE